MKMFSNKKIENEAAVHALMEEDGDFTESGYLLTDEYLDRLARSTFTASNLPEGDEYVAIIGHGYEKSNREAVYTLILKNIDALSEVHGIHHLEKALDLLKGRFRDVESYYGS